MPTAIRLGPSVLLSAASYRDGLASWAHHSESRGASTFVADHRIASGRLDRHGALPLVGSTHASTGVRMTARLTGDDVARLVHLYPGAVELTSGASKALGLATRVRRIEPRAWALVPVEAWAAYEADGTRWTAEDDTCLVLSGIAIVSEGHTLAPIEDDTDDVYDERAYEVEIVAYAAPGQDYSAVRGFAELFGLYIGRDVLLLSLTVSDNQTITPVVDLSSGTATWEWGDGSESEVGTNPSHTYAVAGTYTVRLNLSDSYDSLTALQLQNDPFTFDVGLLAGCTALEVLYLQGTDVTGDVAALAPLAQLREIYLHETEVSVSAPWLVPDGLSALRLEDTGLTQQEVGYVAQSIWERRADNFRNTPLLRIGGSNAAPAGTSQAACPPTSDAERLYELANDSCGEGFGTWTVVL